MYRHADAFAITLVMQDVEVGTEAAIIDPWLADDAVLGDGGG